MNINGLRTLHATQILVWVLVGGCKQAGHALGHDQPETGAGRGSRGTPEISYSSVHGLPRQREGASVDAGTATERIIASPCLSPEGVASANATGRLLVALQHLMDGHVSPDHSDPSIAWTWDTNWQTRMVDIPATYGCWCDWGWNAGSRRGFWETAGSQASCVNRSAGMCSHFWRVRTPAGSGNPYLVNGQPQEPELTRRLRDAENLHPEQDQNCIALSAAIENGSGVVTCLGGEGLSSFQIRVPQESVAPGGVLADLGVGSLLRIHGQQILRKTAGHWQWDAVPLAGITVAETPRAGCSLPPPPATVYPVVTQLGQEVTFPLVWSSGGNTFIGIRRYFGHDARRAITPITVSVSGAELSGNGLRLTVRWTALTTERIVRFVCSDRRLFAGQGIMLQFPDGNRLVPTRAGGPHPRPNQPTDGSCTFLLPQPLPQGPLPVGYKLIYVPADNLPGWWQDDFGGLPRPRAVLEVDLAGSPRRQEPTPPPAAPSASTDAGGPGVDAGAASSGAAIDAVGRPRHHHRARPRNPRPGPDLGDILGL
ncbi:MAG: hypothetical protein JWM10_3193 [Myxococcaceae bacterium]|nr:hypothetical protein [Myxococcaceae bacterium]